MKRTRLVVMLLSMGAGFLLSGCETGDEAADHYQVRVTNNSSVAVELRIDGALKRTVDPDNGERATVSDDEHRVTLQWAGGKQLFEQTINLNDGTYVRYTVSPGGEVTATGGTWNGD